MEKCAVYAETWKSSGRCNGGGFIQRHSHFEYSPRKIKQSITGNGAASKEQVYLMLQKIVRFAEIPDYLDATDAIAAAVCHSFQHDFGDVDTHKVKIPRGKKSYNSWASFLENNPDKNYDKVLNILP